MELLFLSTFGKAFVLKPWRPHLRSFFEKTGRDDVPYHTIGLIFWVSAFITYLLYMTLIYPLLGGSGPFRFFIISFVFWAGMMLLVFSVIAATWYFFLTMVIYKRTKEMEAKLADYFTLVSTNLRGGYSFEKSLWGAIRPEFGILAKEIALASKRVMTGNDVGEALEGFVRKYDSPILRRAMSLIIGELEAGGRVVDVIERVIVDLKKTKALRREMEASTLTYVIFISALVLFVMPLLFALSFILFNVIFSFLGQISSTLNGGGVSMISITKPSINPRDYKIFTFLAIAIISTSSALLVSIVEKGDLRAGAKYVPIFFLVSTSSYLFFLWALQGLFSGFLPFVG